MSLNRPLLLLIYVVVALVVLSTTGFADTIRLAIAYSDSLNSTMRTIRGMRSTIDKHYNDVIYEEFLLTSDANIYKRQFTALEKYDPKLILTVGSFATKQIADRITDRPIIFSAVLNPETSGFVKTLEFPGGNITGASLDIPPDIQFKYFKQVIGELKHVGVLYTKETENLIPSARGLAAEAGLTLHTVKINSEKDIPRALDSLNRICDGLWSVADFNIYSPRSTRFILLNTLRNSKPFMGFSKNLVEAGALFGLSYDYKDIGRQAGKIAVEVLSGRPPASTPVAKPGIIWFHYNEKTANHIKVTIPDDLASVAKEVYR